MGDLLVLRRREFLLLLRILLLLLLHLQLLLLLSKLNLLVAVTFVKLMTGSRFLDLLRSFWRDVHSTNRFSIWIQRCTGVLSFVPRADGFDHQGHFTAIFVVYHLMFIISFHLQSLSCPDNLWLGIAFNLSFK